MRSTLCDLQNEKYIFLPNELVDLFEQDLIDTELLKLSLNEEEFEELQKFLSYLEQNDYVFNYENDMNGFFPELSGAFHFPGEISNAIIEISKQNISDILTHDIFEQLLFLGCRNLELRIFDFDTLKPTLFALMKTALFNEFLSVDICIDKVAIDPIHPSVFRFLKLHRNVRSLVVFNDKETKAVLTKSRGFGGFAFIKGSMDSSNCGYISPAYFNINIQTYTESLKHNSCLNKKAGIDKNGFIKNCPSCSVNFGHISKHKLADVIIKDTSFKKYFDLNKNQIKVCRDCEFRHICTDCRVFVSDEADIYSKPSKCLYDPYTTTWMKDNG